MFPENWKRFHVDPTYKKGNKAGVQNYRHLSLLEIISKDFERCLYIELKNDLKSHFIILINLVSRIGDHPLFNLFLSWKLFYSCLDSRDYVYVVDTDYEKTFDRVDHAILLTEFFFYGIRGKLLNFYNLISVIANKV